MPSGAPERRMQMLIDLSISLEYMKAIPLLLEPSGHGLRPHGRTRAGGGGAAPRFKPGGFDKLRARMLDCKRSIKAFPTPKTVSDH